MSNTHCPLCYTELEVVDVSPCMDCGTFLHEIEDAVEGKHTYAELRIFGDLSLVLCNFCMVDFGSYDPTYFGLPKGTKIGYGKKEFVRAIEVVYIGKDKYCPNCHRRLAFLKFVEQARQLHASQEASP
jgi:hypothetical protein